MSNIDFIYIGIKLNFGIFEKFDEIFETKYFTCFYKIFQFFFLPNFQVTSRLKSFLQYVEQRKHVMHAQYRPHQSHPKDEVEDTRQQFDE